jgi:hypothetical protein
MTFQSQNTIPVIGTAGNLTVPPTNDFTLASFDTPNPYITILSDDLNIFSGINRSVIELENTEVREQVESILSLLYLALLRASQQKYLNNYLSPLNLNQQEDKAALLEWSFEKFRIGFLLEPDSEKSFFFQVSQDEKSGTFNSERRRLGDDVPHIVNKIVEYVLNNT